MRCTEWSLVFLLVMIDSVDEPEASLGPAALRANGANSDEVVTADVQRWRFFSREFPVFWFERFISGVALWLPSAEIGPRVSNSSGGGIRAAAFPRIDNALFRWSYSRKHFLGQPRGLINLALHGIPVRTVYRGLYTVAGEPVYRPAIVIISGYYLTAIVIVVLVL